MRIVLLAGLLSLAALACQSPSATQPTTPVAAATLRTGSPTVVASLVSNGVLLPLPSDVPRQVLDRPALFSCGAEVLFEADPDVSPIPTVPPTVTGAAVNERALSCLLGAWRSGRPAEMTTAETSDEGDEVYTIYGLPGDSTVVVYDRVWSHTDLAVAWATAVCRQLTVEAGRITPLECAAETPLH